MLGMKDYYDVLDIPVTATPEEIKAKYRQLVRIYHPDRFSNAGDKRYAEQKLKELNEAYAALTGPAQHQRTTTAGLPPPIPIVEPALLDFGLLPPNRRTRARIQVGNTGGAAQQMTFAYSDEQPWFTITKGRQIYPDRPVPLEFEVLVNTSALEPSQQYAGWVEINMDGVTARAILQLQVGEPAPTPQWSRRIVVATLLALLLIALVVTAPLLHWLDGDLAATSAAALTGHTATTSEPGVISSDAIAQAAEAVDWTPIFSTDGRQLAFLSTALGAPQLFVRDPQSGRLRQLTNSTEPKTSVVWSPDGSRLVFLAGDTGRQQLHIVEVASGAIHPVGLAASTTINRFAWSKDAQSLVIETSENGLIRLYRVSPTVDLVTLLDPPLAWEQLELAGNSP
jgi:hypothetical protein